MGDEAQGEAEGGRHRLIHSGPLPVRGNDEQYSRLTHVPKTLADSL